MNALQRLENLERKTGALSDKVTVTYIDGTTKQLLWCEALELVLSNEISDIDGIGELAGLCKIMMR